VIDANAVKEEAKLHDSIVEYCKDRGWLYFHGSLAHRTYRTAGENDFHILAPGGRVFFIECKDKDGKCSIEQLGVIKHAAMLGHEIHVVRSMERFKEIVESVVGPLSGGEV
jgi:hypothetical protein